MRYGGLAGGLDTANGLAAFEHGVVLIGNLPGSVDFGDRQLTADGTSSDVFATLSDANGAPRWTGHLTSPAEAYGFKAAIDERGVAIIGVFYDSLLAGSGRSITNSGMGNLYVALFGE